jgi:hypothetical protein
VRRVEFALPIVPVIINFGPAWALGDGHKPDRMTRYGSFTAGMYSTYAISQNTTYRAWLGSSLNRQDADAGLVKLQNGSSGNTRTSSEGIDYYETSHSLWRFDNTGTGSVRSRTHSAGAQAIQQLHRSAELTVGFTISGNRRASRSGEVHGYSINNIWRTEQQDDGSTDSFFGLNEYDMVWLSEFDRRELNYSLPVSLSIGIFSFLTASATVMPEWRRWKAEISRASYLADEPPQTRPSPTPVYNHDDSARTLNGLLTLRYTPAPGAVISVTGLTNRSEAFTGNISQPARFRFAANLEVQF